VTPDRSVPELDRTTERRVAALVIAGVIVFFLIALALAPTASPTYDDAKYVGIGRNVLAGDGPRTVFGEVFLKHSPVWPVLVALPERLIGLDPLVWGHLLNALSAAAIILMTAVLGWRIRPVYGAAGAIALLALPYFFDIARTAGIDMPSIGLTLLYLLLGFAAVRRDSLAIGLLAGLVFAAAFLIKETVQPYALVPFLAGVLWGISWTTLARVGAATLATAALGTSWWFIVFAQSEHLVYRLELPVWTLVPGALAVVVLVVLGLAANRIAANDRVVRLVAAASSGTLGAAARRLGRPGFAWLVAAIWVVALTVLFSRTSKLLGSSIVDPNQIAYYLGHAILSVRLAVAYGLGSLVLAVALVRGRPPVAQPAVDLLLAVACGIPLVLLVIGVGETPRHYLTELILLLVLGTVGWVAGLDALVGRRDRVIAGSAIVLAVGGAAIVGLTALGRLPVRTIGLGLVAVAVVVIVGLVVGRLLAARGRLLTTGPVIALIVALLFVGSAVDVRAARLAGGRSASERTAAADINGWIRANATPGSTVAIGPYLSMATAIDLPAGYRAVGLRHYLAVADPGARLGLAGPGGSDRDFIAIDNAPGKANDFNVYDAASLDRIIRTERPDYLVYSVNLATSSRSILGVLTPDHGFTELATLRQPDPSGDIETHIYQVDPARLSIDPDQIWISADALERLVDSLEQDHQAGRIAAANLVGRIVAPADGSLDGLLARLRAIAGG
jgi:hypothetical protein